MALGAEIEHEPRVCPALHGPVADWTIENVVMPTRRAPLGVPVERGEAALTRRTNAVDTGVNELANDRGRTLRQLTHLAAVEPQPTAARTVVDR